jgi:hypothetical protein
LLFAVVLLIGPAAMAQIGTPSGGGDSVAWNISASGHSSIELRVSCAGDVQISKSFKGGKPVTLSVRDFPGNTLENGACSWEMYTVPFIPPGVAKLLTNARAAGDEKAASRILRDAGISSLYQSGGLQVDNGGFVSLSGSEGQSSLSSPTKSGLTTNAVTGPNRGFNPVVNDQVIPDDLIVQGSECVGLDCVNNESFGFDTIRLKENNTRIKFEDTSSSAGFPTNDWQLTANDSASGGSSKFSIEDITGSKVPFTVTAGASTNSIFVDSTGRIGARTSTPVLDFHIATSNTPAIRLEQNNSGGFTAQTWDIAGNEANFFVRDVTGGSRLPFRIRPGAPTSSIDISASGNVGIGTASPNANLQVGTPTSTSTATPIVVSLGGTFSSAAASNTKLRVYDDGTAIFGFGVSNAQMDYVVPASAAHVKYVGATERFRVNSTGATVTGNLTVTGTKNFAQVDPADPKKAIYYVALEGPEAGTYFRGSAKMVNGVAEIELPGYFSRITECERLTVQLTPTGKWGQMYVAFKSPEKLVIKSVDGTDDLGFDYLVQGVRKGYLDYQVERKNELNH